jgi:hypothetical protein
MSMRESTVRKEATDYEVNNRKCICLLQRRMNELQHTSERSVNLHAEI